MISFCLLNEDAFDDWQGSDVLSPKGYNNPEEYISALETDVETGRRLFADRKGAESHMTNPGDSLWSWIPGSDESNAENKIEDTDAMIRRIKNEPELFYTYKEGKPAPGFTDHPIGYTLNTFADHPTASVLGAGLLTTAAYFGKKNYDRTKVLQNQNRPIDVNRVGGAAENFRRVFSKNPATGNN